jgi:glucokinase
LSASHVGVDLGATKILARVIDPDSGRGLARIKRPTPTGGPVAVLEAVIGLVADLDGFDRATAVGVGVPGLVVERTVVVRCPNIPGWDSPLDVGRLLSEALGKPVVVGNDVNCGAVAEHRLGAGSGVEDLMAVFVGTGVGGGLILGGRLIDGERGLGGEIGHVTVVAGGRPCGCGGEGHLEAYAGRAGIERRARELASMGRPSKLVELAATGGIRSRHLAIALADGDEVATELVGEAVEALALVIGNMATMLDLRRVVLGGGVVDRLGLAFVDRIAASRSFGGFGHEMCELSLAQRLDDAGVVGAALMAADHFG